MEPFRRVAIVGVGLIGGSIGLAARERGLAACVVGIESNADAWSAILQRGAADTVTDDLAAGVADADCVILAVPVEQAVAMLTQIAPLLAADAIVTDVGSVKGVIAAEGRAALGARFVAGHPMAGSERGGIAAARADLFEGATWALTPGGDTDPRAAARIEAFAAALGAFPLILTPQAHDEAVALTSHLPHVIAYVLCAMAWKRMRDGDADVLRLAAGSWASATRVAESSPALWLGITGQNREAVAAALDDCAEQLLRVADQLRQSASAESVRDLYSLGHATKMDEARRRGRADAPPSNGKR